MLCGPILLCSTYKKFGVIYVLLFQGHFHFAGGKGPEVPGPTSQPGQECAWHTAVSPQVAQAQGGPLQQRAMPHLTG